MLLALFVNSVPCLAVFLFSFLKVLAFVFLYFIFLVVEATWTAQEEKKKKVEEK